MKLKKNTIAETLFKEKYPHDILSSWENSHQDIPRIINEKQYEIGVEIGVAYGGHCESILQNTNVRKLYGIDPYQCYTDYNGDNQNFEQEKQDDLYEMVAEKFKFYNERFEIIRNYSNDASKNFIDNSLDFVYIDGNHFDEFLKQDLHDWWKKVKSDGMLSGHDYNHSSFPNLTIIVNSFFDNIGRSVTYLGNHNWCVFK